MDIEQFMLQKYLIQTKAFSTKLPNSIIIVTSRNFMKFTVTSFSKTIYLSLFLRL